MSESQHRWEQLTPGDSIECGDGPALHRWRVLGIYLGALGQESLVEMESETHSAGWTGEYHPRLFVPMILLRGQHARITPKEAVE